MTKFVSLKPWSWFFATVFATDITFIFCVLFFSTCLLFVVLSPVQRPFEIFTAKWQFEWILEKLWNECLIDKYVNLYMSQGDIRYLVRRRKKEGNIHRFIYICCESIFGSVPWSTHSPILIVTSFSTLFLTIPVHLYIYTHESYKHMHTHTHVCICTVSETI